ncbi:hypothetical protein ACFQT0_16490 [Hymenobacter humi]|uniref:AI-2E family transporter n=1 Tax=Hymenobacter humi TaxID=1411620 RepID=A0ABW2U5S7_9BACT
MGLLIGLTLLFGVVAELTLLPLLILYFYKRPAPVAETGQLTKVGKPAGR